MSSTVAAQVGSYNVNGRKPPAGLQLAPWLAGAARADVVIVTFQEIVPLNANNVFNGGRPSADACSPDATAP